MAAIVTACASGLHVGEGPGVERGVGFIRGRILSGSGQGKVFVVILYQVEGGRGRILDFQMVDREGTFGFLAPAAGWTLVAFEDRNGNGKLDDAEPRGFLDPRREVGDGEENTPASLSLRVSENGTIPPGYPVDLARFRSSVRRLPPGPGALTDLGNIVFSRPYGKMGLWNPLGFIREVGGGVYFVEPYEKARIPVLFIHGSGGTPRDWRCVMDEWATERYQPWFFYYPSGPRLTEIARRLHWEIRELQRRYGFERLFLIAHSMGGLVARELINRLLLEGGPRVPVLVSISSPWGGLDSAGFGAAHSPIQVPSWTDLAPGSTFLEGLHRVDIRPLVRHYLLYGYGSMATPVTPGGDGIVAVESVLEPRIRKEAFAVYGFKARHGAILCSEHAVERCMAILAEEGNRD